MNALIVSVMDADIDEALNETIAMLRAGSIDELEASWAYLCANSGERLASIQDAACWSMCLLRTWSVIQTEESLRVADALALTARLCFVHKRLQGAGSGARGSIAQLRMRIQDAFPEGAALSAKGAQEYRILMPERNTEEERALATRILAGLCKLWAERQCEESRAAIEYLSRRSHVLPLSNWPAPTLDDAVKGDIVWFLWGAILLYCREDAIKAAHALFCWKWRKMCRKMRMGLLWGCAFLMCVGPNDPTETARETYILGQVRDLAGELWKEAAPPPPSAPVIKSGMDYLATFVPRGTERTEATDATPTISTSNPRVIHVAGDSLKGKAASMSNETHRVDSRDRRDGAGEAWGDAQDRPETARSRQSMDQYLPLINQKRTTMETRHGRESGPRSAYG